MSRYKAGDKVVVEIEKAALTDNGGGFYTVLDYMQSAIFVDEKSEPLTTYTEPLEAKIRRQAAEITRLLRENKELKNEKQELTRERNQLMGRCGGLSAAKIKAFNQGAEAAWELARKIVSDIYHGGYNSDELKEIFGYSLYQNIWEDNTYPEAAAKVAQWEKAKEEINIGDVIRINEDNDFYGLVININPESRIAFVVSENRSLSFISLECCIKTGRHIDVDSFLKQIGGKQE